MSDDHPHVQLGAHSLPVYPQPWRRVVKRLGRSLDAIRAASGDEGFDADVFVGALGGRLYETFEAFIPKLKEFLPEYEFNGYTSPVAWQNDNYDEDNDPSPTFPQFIDAVELFVEINGGNRFLAYLGKVFDPKMIRAEMSLALSEWREGLSMQSPSSPGTSTESPPSGSTPTGQTAEASSGSSEIDSLDFAPRGEWMPERSGDRLTTSA